MKNIDYVYKNNQIKIAKLIADIIQYLEYMCLSIINNVKVRVFINHFSVVIFFSVPKYYTFMCLCIIH